ncbi:PTS fructose-like transporter subunit IIB [Skermanella rosea]|uniref:PTS fructose-like transporter subunit IIB n=1 Tax=Skermanella rosea TaxID=1817965 RepID=UPI00193153FD|nr:PTS fructose-like transporter subunit IIB [Skermanella rosea]UEM01467.1 PTS fructose-like transporter subunit IIB [Skermanella rosea]
MKKVVAVTGSRASAAHTAMAAEALEATADMLGYDIRVERLGPDGTSDRLSDIEIRNADVVILATDQPDDQGRFEGKTVRRATPSEAIRHTARLLREAIGDRDLPPVAELASPGTVPLEPPPAARPAPPPDPAPQPSRAATPPPAPPAATQTPKRIVAITSCPTGIAHTFMAAEALNKAARALGHQIKVETQGSVGAGNPLTPEEIEAADVVIIAADTNVALDRFAHKRVYSTSTGRALKGGKEVITTAFEKAEMPGDGSGNAPAGTQPAIGRNLAGEVERLKAERSAQRTGPYKHLMTGVSYTIPVVVAGGLAIALSFMFGIDAANQEGSLAAALMQIGGQAAFALMVPVLSGYIAFSIADRPGLAPGLIGGMLASQIGAGFLGGLASGFLAGYIAYYLRSWIRLPQNLEGLKPVLIIPLLASVAVGLLMIYVVGTPIAAILSGLTAWLSGMTSANAVFLGLLLGGMMAVDMGGPVNKSAYTFAVGLLASQTYLPMAAVMAAGMTPPLGLALATMLAKNRFTPDERDAGKAAAVLGISFITEGAIPFAAKDPLRVIPPAIVGSALTGALSMLFGCMLRAPHGGIFVLGIPNAVTNVGFYALAIVIGTVVTAGLVIVFKKPGTEATLGAEAA